MKNVHHITPGRSDRNLGKSINDIVKLLPEDDWICLRDIDTIPMYHEVFFKQCEEIADSGEFDLVGCLTNRLGFAHQLYDGIKSTETDIMVHRKIAKELYEKYGSKVEEIKRPIGGLFMLFSKKTWIKAGGFEEGGIFLRGNYIDYHFSAALKIKKMRIGMANGIYLFHYYRMEYGDNTKTIEARQHLL